MRGTATRWKLGFVVLFTLATLFLIVNAGALSTVATAFYEITIIEGTLLGLLFIALRIFQALSFLTVIRQSNTIVTFKTSLWLAGLKGLYNLGFSGAGLAAQAFHGRSKGLFTVPQLAWATGLQSLLLVSASGAALAVSALVIQAEAAAKIPLLLLGVLAALFPLLAIRLATRPGWLWKVVPTRFQDKIISAAKAGDALKKRRLALVWLIQAGIVVLRVARIVAIALFLESQAAVGRLAMTTLFADLITVVPLTPAGIGVREFVIGLGAEFSGHLELFISAAVIDRGFAIFGNLVHGLLIFLAQLKRRHAH